MRDCGHLLLNNLCSTCYIFKEKLFILKIKIDLQTWINSKKYFSKLNVILKSKKQNLDLLKYSFLKILAFISLRLFWLKICPKKVAQWKFLAIFYFSKQIKNLLFYDNLVVIEHQPDDFHFLSLIFCYRHFPLFLIV